LASDAAIVNEKLIPLVIDWPQSYPKKNRNGVEYKEKSERSNLGAKDGKNQAAASTEHMQNAEAPQLGASRQAKRNR
jgi:hypothetical protein